MRPHFTVTFLTLVLLGGACARSSPRSASTGGTVHAAAPGAMPRCAASGGDTTGTVYFEFQVERPALPRTRNPEPPRLGAEVLLQFVVDTAGQIDLNTVKVMKSERAAATRRLQEALPSLEYEPAVHQGCRVRQLVQRAFS